jgi:hypothetical protein
MKINDEPPNTTPELTASAFEFTDDVGNIKIIGLAEPLPGRRGSVLDR